VELVCEQRNFPVLRVAGMDNRSLRYDARPLAVLWRLAVRRYDVVIDTEQFHHFSAVLAWLSRARMRVGFKINPRRNPLYTHLVNYAPDGPEGSQFACLLEPLGIRDSIPGLAGLLRDIRPVCPPPVEAELRKLGEGGRGLAVLQPGASTPYKRWDEGRLAELARRLAREHGLAPVLVGGAPDAPAAARLCRMLADEGCAAGTYAGRLGLSETAAVMQRGRLFVGSDSGLAHLAIALDVPSVVLFGPSDSLKWGINDARRATVRRDVPCAPCFIFGYHRPCRTFACMGAITVEDVLAACRRVLAGASAPPRPPAHAGAPPHAA
jgi:ADP-heptose:LPS heptosyltransferase